MNYYFEIAEHIVCIRCAFQLQKLLTILPSFRPFYVEKVGEVDLLFHLSIEDELPLVHECECHPIRTFDTGNGDTIVDKLISGGYQFQIKDIYGERCALLMVESDFKTYRCSLYGKQRMASFGLNNVLMLAMAFAGCLQDTLLIHASTVKHGAYAYPFIAKSGTGKSTHVANWLRHIPGCELMNDDNPIIRIIDGEAYIYGSPWSGKTPCYRKIKAKLGAITRIDRAKGNSIERLSVVQAFASLLPSCSSMKWDEVVFRNICDVVSKFIQLVPIYTLHCLPDVAAAELSYKTLHQ